MEIYSVRAIYGLSKQTSDNIRKIVLAAPGPVVLPLQSDVLAHCRVMAKNPVHVDAIRRYRFALDMDWIATLAIAEGKTVFPFFNSGFQRMQREFEMNHYESEKLLHETGDRLRAHAFREKSDAHVVAKQMVALWERWRKTKPSIVIAEDNFAQVLGRLSRVRVTRLTRDDRATPKLVRRTLKEIPPLFGTRKKRKPRKK